MFKIEQTNGGLLAVKVGPSEAMKSDTGDLILLVSTEVPDSDGDVVYQRPSDRGTGWNLDRFNAAPVITWQHNMSIPNLSGPRTRAKVSKHPTKGWGLFLDPLQFDEGDEFAQVLDGKYRRDVLKESSVGFYVTEHEPRVVDGEHHGMHIYSAELSEVAAVNRGANPETETMAKALLVKYGAESETAGDTEARELAAELGELRDVVDMLSNELKILGDRVTGDGAAAVEKAAALRAQHETEQLQAAGELLAALRRVGTAHQ